MSTGGGPLFGGGGFFGGGGSGDGGWARPSGPYGPWAGCGCSSLFFILAGILLICGGCMRMFDY
jgi:hypothetical protein